MMGFLDFAVVNSYRKRICKRTAFCWIVTVIGLWSVLGQGAVEAAENLARGQVLYLPVYSEVPYGDKGYTLNLTATLSLRNTDRKSAITVKRIDYFNAAGAVIRSYLKKPASLGPMATTDYIVKESDRSGGISASFLVEWESDEPVTSPFVEVIMVNSTYNQGIGFSSPARVLDQRN